MKKVNKIAAQDAVRYIQAKKTLNEINQRAWQDVKYADAVDAAVNRIESNATSIALAEKSSSPLVKGLKVGAVVAIAAIVLHETGYDTVLKDKVVRWAKRTKHAAEEKAEDLKEQHPYAAEAARNVADTAKTAATDIKDTAKDAYQKETGQDEPEPFKPSAGQGPWSGESPRARF